MGQLIKRLTDSVAFAEKEGENMDDVSWGMQEGILISYNEAKAVIEALKAFKISSNTLLVAGGCRKCGSRNINGGYLQICEDCGERNV